jgi:hypothetical protein
MTDQAPSLQAEVNDLMQRIISINDRWPGDYALFVEASCSERDTVTHFSWYYKPPLAAADGDMAMLAERPPGYKKPADGAGTQEASDG